MSTSNSYSKFTFLILTIMVLSLFSCDRYEDSDLPGTFTKKVVIEEFSGEWCSACVPAAAKFQSTIEENPEHIFGVSIHSGDPFELEFPKISSFLINEFSIKYFPYAIIDRTSDDSKSWLIQSENRLKEKSNIGLKIETSIEENILDIKIDFTSNIDFNNILLTVYLIENNVPESSPGAQSAGGGNYIHHHLLREVLSGKIGDPVDIINNSINTKEYNDFNIAKYKKSDLSVVAFLHHSSTESYEVLNSNGVKVGESIGW